MEKTFDGVTIGGYFGEWSEVDTKIHEGKRVYLMESDVYGDEAGYLIVDGELTILLDEVYNGLEELDY